MSNGTHAAPRPVWFPSPPDSSGHPHESKRHSAALVERSLLACSAVVVGLVVVSAQSVGVGRYASLIVGSFSELPEQGSLLFFGLALIGLGVWVRRRPA